MVDEATVEHYVRRAVDFLTGMQLMRDDPAYQNSSALLAIHSAIAYSDALRIGLGETALSTENHANSVAALRRLLRQREVQAEASLRHLQTLLSFKSAVAYGSTRVGEDSYRLLFLAAERYSNWANRVGLDIGVQGWRAV